MSDRMSLTCAGLGLPADGSRPCSRGLGEFDGTTCALGAGTALALARLVACLTWAAFLIMAALGASQAAANNDRMLRELERQHEQQRERDREQFRAQQEELQQRGDEQLRRIDQLRSEIERCGRCQRRESLQAEHDALVAQRQLGIDLACAALQGMGAMNPALGSALACRNVAAERSDERLRRLHAAAEGGANEALLALGMAYRSRDRSDEACKYFRRLAQRDFDPGIVYLDGCLWERHDAGDPALLLAKLPGCAARKVPECQFALGRLMTSLEHPKLGSRQLTLPFDEPRALRLWQEAAAATGWRHYAEMAEALRLHISRGPNLRPEQPTPPPPPQTDPGPHPVTAFAERSYMAVGHDALRRPFRVNVSIDIQSDGSYLVYRGTQKGRGLLEGSTLTVDFNGLAVAFERKPDGSLVGRFPHAASPEVWHPQSRASRAP